MTKFLLTTFFIFSLSIAGTLETIDCHDKDNIEKSTSSQVSLENINHEHKGEEDCEDRSGHCTHHCSGIHNLLQFNMSVKLENQSISYHRSKWYYDHHYVEPFLDSAIKPPLFF